MDRTQLQSLDTLHWSSHARESVQVHTKSHPIQALIAYPSPGARRTPTFLAANSSTFSHEHSSPGGTGPLGFSLAVGWAFLLITGALSWWRNTEKTPFDRFLSFSIVGQLGLHFVYGTELFLYGPHVAPLLLLVTARGLGALDRSKLKLALLALGVFVPLLALHNLARYTQARALFLQDHEAREEAVDPESQTKPHALSPTITAEPSA